MVGMDTATQHLDYPALARAAAGPLRKWWWRTGWWWGGLLILALAYRYVYSFHLNISTSGNNVYAIIGSFIEMVAWPGAMVVWLLAARRFNLSFNAVFPEGREPGLLDLAQFRFIHGVRQGLIPMAAFTVFSFAHTFLYIWGLAQRMPSTGQSMAGMAWFHSFLMPVIDPLALPVAMLWLLALLSVCRGRGKAPWALLAVVFFLQPLARTVFTLLTDRLAMLPYNTTGARFFGLEPGWLGLLSLALVVAAVLSFRHRQAILGWLACGVIFLSSGCDLWRPGLATSTSIVLDTINRFLRQLDDLAWALQYFPAWLASEKESPLVNVQLILPGKPVIFSSTQPLAYEALFLLINLAWIALLYWFIRNVLLRPAETPGPVTDD